MGQKDTEEVLSRVKCGQMGERVPLASVSLLVYGCCVPGERIMGAPGRGHEAWTWSVWPGAYEKVLAREAHLEASPE